MADAKKYYWLKLKRDFFDEPQILIIEHCDKGDMILLLYIKMLLDSVPDGTLYIADKHRISGHYKVSVQDFEYAISQMSLYQLIYVDENDVITFPYVTKQTILKSDEATGRDRNTTEYKKWRVSVFERDNFTCQKCGVRGGKLNAHHIKTWRKHPDLRFELSNGITLCEDCHKVEHRRMRNGRKTNVCKNNN